MLAQNIYKQMHALNYLRLPAIIIIRLRINPIIIDKGVDLLDLRNIFFIID